MAIQKDVRRAIDSAGITRYRIAKDLNLDYGTVHRFYHGQVDIHVRTLDKIVGYLGLRLQPEDKSKAKQRGKQIRKSTNPPRRHQRPAGSRHNR